MISGDRSILSGRTGGPFETTLRGLAAHFDHISVLCPRVRGSKRLEFLPNVILQSSPFPLIFQPLWIFFHGLQLEKEQHFSVVTVHEYPPFYNGFGARFLMRYLHIPFVAEIHHLVGEPTAASFSEWCGRMLSKFVVPSHLNRFSAVRVVNTVVADTLIARGVKREKTHVIPSLYLDRTVLVPDATILKNYDIVFCGRLVANKGLFELLDAAAALPDRALLIIGDGPLRECVEQRARELNILHRVTFAGWLPSQAAVIQALQSARVFVMNSKSEGGPRVLVEAMALGLPVIATSVGIVPSILRDGENGILTNGNAEDLAQKLQSLLENPAQQQSIGLAARSVIDVFDSRRTLSGYAKFLLECKNLPSLQS